MARATPPPTVPPEVRAALGAVRRRIRSFVWLEGLAVLTILLGVVFWLGLGLDWWLEPSPAVRGMSLIIIGFGLAAAAFWVLLRRLLVPLSDANLALLLERQDRRLGDHVATVVSLADEHEGSQRYHPELVAQTAAAAEDAVRNVEIARLFDYRPLWTRCALAAGAVLSVVLFAVLAAESFGFWVDRIALSPENWPRRVRLEVLGFPTDDDGRRVQTIARDGDLELTVRAHLTGEHVAPERVAIRFRLPDGRSGRDYLTRIGRADPQRDEFQTFRYSFKNVRTDLSLEVFGGDDRVRDLRLRVVDRPELVSIDVDCTYPKYLRRSPDTLTATGGVRVPVGSQLVVRATASKPLRSVLIESLHHGSSNAAQASDGPANEVEYDYGRLDVEDTLLVSLTDDDGIESRQPYRLSLTATPDELPQIAVSLKGIGSAVTPDAQIPFVGQVRDDYGLREAWFEFAVDSAEPRRRPLQRHPNGRTEINEIGAFDLRASAALAPQGTLKLQPGQKLSLTIAASDHCDLDGGPRVGKSQHYVLDVVTPADLLLLIERRELAFRQRFEAIYEKVTDTRAMLARVEFPEEASSDEPSDERPADETNSEAASAATTPSDRVLALRRLRVAGAGQNITQAADEVLNVAEGFENLHDQLVNNRIENRELMDRLKLEIATPLRQISQVKMPELESQLKSTQEVIADEERGPYQVEGAIKLTDVVLSDMKSVLERMLELETYNEVVALLRGIISDQTELNERTKERRQQSLRSLLED